MKWKTKARIQNIISALPEPLSYWAYFKIQRAFGNLKTISQVNRIKAGIEICRKIQKYNQSPVDKLFFEVGTGRRINMPLAIWLLGARKTITVDLNPYLKKELICEDIRYITQNSLEIQELFKGMELYEDRFEKLMSISPDQMTLEEILSFFQIEYIAPGDASNVALESHTVDYHISYTVFEHIPRSVILKILRGGNRIVKKDGLFVHFIDMTDHFSHSDQSITPVNFLQYNEREWDGLAGNRFMYMNRLRVDDYEEIFKEANHKILENELTVDASVIELLKNKEIALDSRFESKPDNVLATLRACVISQKAD